MKHDRRHNEWQVLECYLTGKQRDFLTTYMHVRDIHALILDQPDLVSNQTVDALASVLKTPRHTGQKKAYFLYRIASQSLADIATKAPATHVKTLALNQLKDIVTTGTNCQHRAASEAMGSLPLSFNSGHKPFNKWHRPSNISWEKVLNKLELSGRQRFQKFGRSIVSPLNGTQSLVVLKFSDNRNDSRLLQKEAFWMERLKSMSARFHNRFEIPRPVAIDGSYAFQVDAFPERQLGIRFSSKTYYAICFFAKRGYFEYPNTPDPQKRLDQKAFKSVIFKNAWLLGVLASAGIVHTAPIPLFHNRVQSERRSDLGLYEWQKSGRLDSWLHSSLYPNFATTGLRDFEHFETIDFSKKIYHYIGLHLLSFILVAGSYFRNQAPFLAGYDSHDRPVDTRHLFDKSFFKQLLGGIFDSYYQGFTGLSGSIEIPFNVDILVEQLVDAMGVDRHMEEYLRITDQKKMQDETFREFLAGRGFTPKEIAALSRGEKDIAIQSGPHLGGFNQKISVPDLTAFLATAAAIMISDKYRMNLI